MIDVASNIPSQGLAQREIHEALSTYHVHTQPSPVESDADLVFSGS